MAYSPELAKSLFTRRTGCYPVNKNARPPLCHVSGKSHTHETSHRLINQRKPSNTAFTVTFNVHVALKQNHGIIELERILNQSSNLRGRN